MRQYDDHHTAMTTALSTAVYLPDVMALEASYVGKFSDGGGLSDLLQPRYDIGRHRSRFVAYAYDQAINRKGQVVAAPTDIGPGTMLYRQDLLDRAGLAASRPAAVVGRLHRRRHQDQEGHRRQPDRQRRARSRT